MFMQHTEWKCVFLLDQHPDSEASLNFEQAYPLLRECVSDDKGLQARCSMRVAHIITGIPEEY